MSAATNSHIVSFLNTSIQNNAMRFKGTRLHHAIAGTSEPKSKSECQIYLPLFRYRLLNELAREDGKVREAVEYTERLTGRKLSGETMVATAAKPAVSLSPLHSFLLLGFCSNSGKYANIGHIKAGRVHELVHVSDMEMESEVKKKLAPSEDSIINPLNPLTNLYLEGRAVFAETLVLLGKLWTPFTAKFFNFRFAMMAGGAAMALAGTLWPREWEGMVQGLVNILPEGIPSIKDSMLDLLKEPAIRIGAGAVIALEGANYWIFHNSLCTLARKIGDPIKAFRITGEKIPGTFRELLFPSKFYKEEIEKALEEKKSGETSTTGAQ